MTTFKMHSYHPFHIVEAFPRLKGIINPAICYGTSEALGQLQYEFAIGFFMLLPDSQFEKLNCLVKPGEKEVPVVFCKKKDNKITELKGDDYFCAFESSCQWTIYRSKKSEKDDMTGIEYNPIKIIFDLDNCKFSFPTSS